MGQKKALLTGVFGQDGIFLSRLLVEKGYDVIGTCSRNSRHRNINQSFIPIEVKVAEVNYLNPTEIQTLLEVEKPDEFYNLHGLSSVGASFENPEQTKILNELVPISTLKYINENLPNIRFYQAGSSEMFGLPKSSPQNENTEFDPKSPYAISKVNVFKEIVRLRDNGLFAVNGIMYNHESEYRSAKFVSRKITKNIARILLRKQDQFSLGDLSIIRDWGYAEDYVNAMWLMLQHEKPQDYVVASGESRTLHDFVREALGIAGLHGDVGNWVVSDPSLFRASEITNLTGDYRRANSELGWEPTTEFPVWVKKMIDNDYMIESNVKT